MTTETNARNVCSELGIQFMFLTGLECTYKLSKCGHNQTSDLKSIMKLDHTPYCGTCIDNAQERGRMPEHQKNVQVLTSFRNKLRRIRSKNAPFSEENVSDILGLCCNILDNDEICLHCTFYNEEHNDIVIVIKCEKPVCECEGKRTLLLTELLASLVRWEKGSIFPVCH